MTLHSETGLNAPEANNLNCDYVPAIRSERALGLYDPLMRLTARERRFKRRLIRQAGLQAGDRILDLGCGTATLALMINRDCPACKITGLDGDSNIMAIARAKIGRAGAPIRLNLGMAQALPYAGSSFDHVFSTLVFHHLEHSQKRAALAEIFRVLRSGGRFHLADWGPPANALMSFLFRAVEASDGQDATSDNRKGAIPGLIQAAGFEDILLTGRYSTFWGTMALYEARKPDAV